jgi:hypothetical protein
MLLMAIEEHCERRVQEMFEKTAAQMFGALEKPGRIQ